ncbi:MAG: hypothetical protein Q8Q26_08465 [Pseudorhodobacter sp.]|nr:hypothetical protein [Pseudorhodobacter sp.]
MTQVESAAFGGHQPISHHDDAAPKGLLSGARLAFILLALVVVLEVLAIIVWGLPVLALVAVAEVPIMMIVILIITAQ